MSLATSADAPLSAETMAQLAMDVDCPTPGKLTFADVQRAVVDASGLPDGARKNLLRAVEIVASQMGAAGLSGVIDVAKIQRRFEKVTPAVIGYASVGGLSSMLSSFRRALRIAGVQVMPGRSRNPLSAEWAALRQAADSAGLWPALSRFAHFCSERGVEPAGVTRDQVAQFATVICRTSMKERADRAERRVLKAWQSAQAKLPGWPQQVLELPPPRKAEASPPWSAYPPSLEADARAFVRRDSAEDWLSGEDRRPLRERTQENYLGALRRAAGELVATGVPPDQLRGLADLVAPERVKAVLMRTAERTGRKGGSGTGLLATVLLLAARDHVRVPAPQLAALERFARATRGGSGMGDRTMARLAQLDDPTRRRALLSLPGLLFRKGHRADLVDIVSARLVRAALFLQLLFDTALRVGNVVALDLDRHLVRLGPGQVTVQIDRAEVKNGVEILAELSPDAIHMLDVYVQRFRPVHAGGSTSRWLFPRPDGSHWTETGANTTLQELTVKHIGCPVNPHLIRAVIAELLEEAHPGALGLARDVLGHRNLATTEAFYARRKAMRSRRAHQAAIARAARGG
jgi:integrase